MEGFVRLAIDIVQFLWPFRLVHQWEMGGYYFRGRFWKVVGPGVYPVIPWFMDVKTVSVVSEPIRTSRQDITLKSGSIVSFTAMAMIRVVDFNLAINTVYDHEHTAIELLEATFAERMASVDADRVSPEKRGRLLADLSRWYQEKVRKYGVEVEEVNFTNFIQDLRTYRLLQDAHL